MPDVEGIANSMPGIIDTETGYCVMGGALSYNDDFYFRHVLYERCPVRIVIENDAKCAAMAEAGMGALKGVNDGLVLIFGTMIALSLAEVGAALTLATSSLTSFSMIRWASSS